MSLAFLCLSLESPKINEINLKQNCTCMTSLGLSEMTSHRFHLIQTLALIYDFAWMFGSKQKCFCWDIRTKQGSCKSPQWSVLDQEITFTACLAANHSGCTNSLTLVHLKVNVTAEGERRPSGRERRSREGCSAFGDTERRRRG